MSSTTTLNKVTICNNPFDKSTWPEYECEDIRDFLLEHFKGTWPDHAMIFIDYVAESTNVTPHSEVDVERLGEIHGHFYIIYYPEWPVWVIELVISIAIAAVSIGLSFLLRPKLNNSNNPSPNNILADRQNTARPFERIPDIFGTVWQMLDLLAVPYREFVGGIETEVCYMCIGRGSYTINQICEDTTDVTQIPGMSVEVYAPGTSPNSSGGPSPQWRSGPAINRLLQNIQNLSFVNGETLLAPNQTGYAWIGPFVIPNAYTTEVWLNFVAEAGLYEVNSGGVQSALSETISIGITPCDGAGNPTSSEQMFTCTITGDNNLRNQCGASVKCVIAGGPTAVIVRCERTTNTITSSGVSVSDQIQWRDCYGVSPVTQTNFGNVTTVQCTTQPTPEALAVQERQLNANVTRNVPQYDATTNRFSSTLYPSNNAIDILCAMALDKYIGNRAQTELDCAGMYQTIAAVQAYFGTVLCTEFCYAFTDDKTSFEESIADIALAIFCTAFRQGNILTLFFEQQTENSVLLFNHRNKLPKTEVRTIAFGTLNNYDGIWLDYIDPSTPNYPNQDETQTIYLPADESSVNPNKITSVGIRNNVQAYFLAWRLYQKLLYQNITTQFDATTEAAMLVIAERILVADNTRPDTQDGEVIEQDGLAITLSQQVTFVAGLVYTIFLQHYDETVESIPITATDDEFQVLLQRAPTVPLVTDPTKWARTTYLIVSNAPTRSSAFLVAEKTPNDASTYKITATNYTDDFYVHDKDYITGAINNSGEGLDNGGGGEIAPGATYSPTQYNDLGQVPTANPTNAYDGNSSTYATVESIYIPGSPADIERGVCSFGSFPSVLLNAPTTLSVKVESVGSSGRWNCTVKCGSTVLVILNAPAGPNIYTLVIPAGTNLATLSVLIEAVPTTGSCSMKVYEISIT